MMGIDVGQLIVSLFVGVAAGIIAAVIAKWFLNRSIKYTLGVAVVCFIMAGLVTAVSYPPVVLVDVPDLIGLSKDEAELRLQERRLIPNSTEQYHDTADRGEVISQDMSPGFRVKKGSEIHFTVSKGLFLGTILVESAPSSANVYLDGIYRGTTPITISDVSAGGHIVNITKSGYEEWSKAITVSGSIPSYIAAPLTVLVPTPTPTPKVWEIGYNDSSYGEFDPLKEYPNSFPWHHNISEPPDKFPKEINDLAHKPINIHFSLCDEQSKNDLLLTLDAHSVHGPDFSVLVKTQINEVGTYTFDNVNKTHKIIIKKDLVASGENTIILDCASPPETNRWLFWDYLSLKAYG